MSQKSLTIRKELCQSAKCISYYFCKFKSSLASQTHSPPTAPTSSADLDLVYGSNHCGNCETPHFLRMFVVQRKKVMRVQEDIRPSFLVSPRHNSLTRRRSKSSTRIEVLLSDRRCAVKPYLQLRNSITEVLLWKSSEKCVVASLFVEEFEVLS